jgi:phytoene dehydrogenase-like protein
MRPVGSHLEATGVATAGGGLAGPTAAGCPARDGGGVTLFEKAAGIGGARPRGSAGASAATGASAPELSVPARRLRRPRPAGAGCKAAAEHRAGR